jgi:hypothetical protein
MDLRTIEARCWVSRLEAAARLRRAAARRAAAEAWLRRTPGVTPADWVFG